MPSTYSSMTEPLPSLKDAGLDTYCMPHRASHTSHTIESKHAEGSMASGAHIACPAQYHGRDYLSAGYSTTANFTPYVSYDPVADRGYRQLSVSTSSSGHHYSTGPSPAEFCTSPSDTSSSDCEQHQTDRRKKLNGHKKPRTSQRKGQSKNPVKNATEQHNRALLVWLIRIKELILTYFCGDFEGTGQSANNQKSSGLGKRKLDVEKEYIAVSSRIIDKLFKEALVDGTVQELQAEWRRYRQEYREAQAEDIRDPTYGTLIYLGGEPCRRGERDICLTHGALDWTQCAPSRVSEIFTQKMDLFLQEHGRSGGKRTTL